MRWASLPRVKKRRAKDTTAMGVSNPNIKCRKLTAIQVYESHMCATVGSRCRRIRILILGSSFERDL
eukprot:scaffold5961_cov72-Skeletonema_dohrnii-CCMP3373.AAC.1